MEQFRQIADESRTIAHLTRRDSTDMRIIALVIMLFLPGTFTAVKSIETLLFNTVANESRPYCRPRSSTSIPTIPLPSFHIGYGFTV